MRVPFIDVWQCLSSFQQSPGLWTLHSLLFSWSFFAFFIRWSCSLGDYFLVHFFFHWYCFTGPSILKMPLPKYDQFLLFPILTFYQKFVLIFIGFVGCLTFLSGWLKTAQGNLIQYWIFFFFYLSSSHILFHLEIHNDLFSFLLL